MTPPRLSWKHIAIFLCIFTPLGFVAWLIHILSQPAYWCGVIVGAGKIAGIRPLVQDCSPILLGLIDKLGSLGLVLVIGAMVGLLTWIVVGLNAKLSFRGPAGIGGEVGGDDPPATKVTTTTEVHP
jgi:hypothetical protein